MMLPLLLLPLMHAAPVAAEDSLLAIVPEDAYAIAHCRDFGALRSRAESNDWYRLLGSPHGEPFLTDFAYGLRGETGGDMEELLAVAAFAYGLRGETGGDMEELLAVAAELRGEVVFFASEKVAGFVAEPGSNPATLTDLMRAWLPEGDDATRRRVELSGGAVELVAWPEEFGRAGHFAALVEHPLALALYSGNDSEAVMAALTKGVANLGGDTRAPIVAAYFESGGGKGNGIEMYIDFAPFIGEAEEALKDAVEGMLPDPTSLLGLENGTWLHVNADIFRGTRVDCQAHLHLPQDTLAAKLADTLMPLPTTLSADLPKGVWGLWALNWDLKEFYQRARAAYEEANDGKGLEAIDGGLQAAKDMADVDPIDDVLNQLAGDFTFYLVDPPKQLDGDWLKDFLMLGFQAGLVDGGAFETALEKLFDFGGLAATFDLEEIAGVDAYVMNDEDDFNGGLAIMPRAFTIAVSRQVLESGLKALTRVEGAGLGGSRMQAAIDENAGVCFLACAEMTPLRRYWLPELKGDMSLPPLEEGGPARDPFDSQLVSTVRRTSTGFEFRLQTR